MYMQKRKNRSNKNIDLMVMNCKNHENYALKYQKSTKKHSKRKYAVTSKICKKCALTN